MLICHNLPRCSVEVSDKSKWRAYRAELCE